MSRYLKAIIGALIAGLTSAQVALTATHGHLHAGEWISIAIATVGTLGGVYIVPNIGTGTVQPGAERTVAKPVRAELAETATPDPTPAPTTEGIPSAGIFS